MGYGKIAAKFRKIEVGELCSLGVYPPTHLVFSGSLLDKEQQPCTMICFPFNH